MFVDSATLADLSALARWSIIATAGLFIVDNVVAKLFKARWFMLHFLGNMVIAGMCLPDLFYVVTDPVNALKSKTLYIMPMAIVIALHIYHILAFKLYWIDWLHHGLMMPSMVLVVLARHGPLINFNNFFICGLPGGIDYLMLAMVKAGRLKPLEEKNYNRMLNVWFRCPFLITTVILCYVKEHLAPSDTTFVLVCRVICGLLVWWNGLYFMQRVVGNFYVTSYKVLEAQKAAERDNATDLKKRLSQIGSATESSVNKVDEHPIESKVMAGGVSFKESKHLWSFVIEQPWISKITRIPKLGS